MNSQLQKRKPTFDNPWTELDEQAASSSFDFRGFDHQLVKPRPVVSNLPPKHSLCRTTFWVTMETPGKILVKCNLSVPPQPLNLENLKAIIEQHQPEEQEPSEFENSEPDLISEISSEVILSPIKPLNEINRIPEEKMSHIKDISVMKPTNRSRRNKTNSQRYRFQDWDKRAEERMMKPTGQAKFNQLKKHKEPTFRLSNFAKYPVEPKPSIEDIKKNWVTMTDETPNHKSSNTKVAASQQEINSSINSNQSKIGRGAKIFQLNSQPQSQIVKNLEKLVPIPRDPTKSTIGIVIDMAKNVWLEPKSKTTSKSQIPESPIPSSQSHNKIERVEQPVTMIPIIDVDDPTPALSLKFLDAPLEKSRSTFKSMSASTFDYQITCQPFSAGADGSLRVNYTDALAEIYAQNPVGSRYYNYKGAPVHLHDKSIMDMLTKFDYTNLLEKSKDIAMIHDQYAVKTNEHASLMINNSVANSRTRFKYVLVKIGLDCALAIEDLMTLEHNELHMLISFFNVKFCLLQKDDKLKPTDPVERILKVANKQIENVLQRAYNFKKNEEFLKKKWKEFLKFCKYKVKEESSEKSKN